MRPIIGIALLLMAGWLELKVEQYDVEWDKAGEYKDHPAPEPGPLTRPAAAVFAITGGLLLVWPRKQQ